MERGTPRLGQAALWREEVMLCIVSGHGGKDALGQVAWTLLGAWEELPEPSSVVFVARGRRQCHVATSAHTLHM